MKIFYAVQATGNGHIARAIELLPYLQQYGEVDIFLSGNNSHLQASSNLPVRFRSRGLSLYYNNSGGLDYWKILKSFSPVKIYREARSLPVEHYDMVINDFEAITSMACRMKGIPSIGFGHQASFLSKNTPRPEKFNFAGETVLKYYAKADEYVGLHFDCYDEFICSPVIKSAVLNANVKCDGHVTVYLPHYSDLSIAKKLKQIKDVRFEVFTKRVKDNEVNKNITFVPIDNRNFTRSMISSRAVITGAGFETPAEALYLKKNLLCLPIRGQYEQLCNARALELMGVPVFQDFSEMSIQSIADCIFSKQLNKLELKSTTSETIAKVISLGLKLSDQKIPSFNIQNPEPLMPY